MLAGIEQLRRNTVLHGTTLGLSFGDVIPGLTLAQSSLNSNATIADTVYSGATLYFQSDYTYNAIAHFGGVDLRAFEKELSNLGYINVKASTGGFFTHTVTVNFIAGHTTSKRAILADVERAAYNNGLFLESNAGLDVTWQPAQAQTSKTNPTTQQLSPKQKVQALGLNLSQVQLDASGNPVLDASGNPKQKKDVADSISEFFAKIGLMGLIGIALVVSIVKDDK